MPAPYSTRVWRTAAFYRVNQACVKCFPTAADIVMGRPVPAGPPVDHGR